MTILKLQSYRGQNGYLTGDDRRDQGLPPLAQKLDLTRQGRRGSIALCSLYMSPRAMSS